MITRISKIKILYANAATSRNENTKTNKDTPVRIGQHAFLANANQYDVAEGSFENDKSGKVIIKIIKRKSSREIP